MESLRQSFNPKAIAAARELLARRRARNAFAAFVARVTDLKPARHHKRLIAALNEIADGKLRRLMVFMPPGHAKSTYASVLFPPWHLIRHPQAAVLAASHSQELADSFGRRARAVVGHEGFAGVSGTKLANDNRAASRWQTDSGGVYFGIGVGGAITGRRADLAIIDDPIKGRAEADSALVRDRTWEWYRADLRTRLKPGGALVLIQTRWHEDDLAGRILPQEYSGESGSVVARDGETWQVISLPALAEQDDPLGRAPGEALWPEWFDAATLEQERVSQGPRNWSALYQQRPAPEEGDYFRSEWLQWYQEPPTHLAIYGASDYAVTAGGGDYTVHGVIGVDALDNLYVLDWWRAQTDSLVWVETLCDLIRKWRPIEWVEEKGPIAKGLGALIDKRQHERAAYCVRHGFASSADKPTRAQAIRGRMAQGKVHFPRKAPWVADLVNELMTFPVGVHDDQVDVMSLFGVMLSRMHKGKKMRRPSDQNMQRQPTVSEIFDEHFRSTARPRGRDRLDSWS